MKKISAFPSLLALTICALGLMTCVVSAQLSGSLTNGLVAYYPFNGNANDQSGFGRDGESIRVGFAPDRFGIASSAADFRNDAYIEVPALRLFNNYPITYSTWLYLETYHTSLSWMGWGDMFIMGKDQPGQGNGAVISLHTTSEYQNSLTYTGSSATGYVPPLNQWIQLALTISANQQATFFINGQELTTWLANAPGYNLAFTDLPFRISTPYIFDQFTRQSFQGYLDDIAIYDRALSSTEVTDLYNAQSVPEPSTYALLLLGGAASLWALKRRKS